MENSAENSSVIHTRETETQQSGRSVHTIISYVAYLLGIRETIFRNANEPPRQEIFEKLEQDKNARIIRHLCILRSAIERNYKNIQQQMLYEYKSILRIDLVPSDSIAQLAADGIDIVNTRYTLNQTLMEINRNIRDRISNCKQLFPDWLNWAYVKDIFIMPNGLTEEGIRSAAAVYYANRKFYPYQMYMNWTPSDEGNILYNDEKFVVLLYRLHHDEFTDMSKVSDTSPFVKSSIFGFLEESHRAVMVVDCENSDPYKLCAVLRTLESAGHFFVKILLYNDVHTASAWKILEKYTKVSVENILIERLKQHKSLVDIRLTAGVCRAYFEEQVDSFVLVSSDSDYWGLISSLPEARYLVMVEREKCSYDMKGALMRSDIFFCYIDDFYTGNNSSIQLNALVREIYRYLDQAIDLNVNDMLEEAYRATRVTMSEEEKRQFYHRFIKPMHLVIEEDGNVSIQLQGR